MSAVTIRYLKFLDKLRLLIDTSLDWNLQRCGVCMEPCTSDKEFVETGRCHRLSVHGGSIDRLIYVGFLIGHQFAQQGVSSLRQPDRAFVRPGLRAAVDGTIAADWRNGGQRKRCNRFDVADRSYGHPIERHRHRQLVELFGRAGPPGPVQ